MGSPPVIGLGITAGTVSGTLAGLRLLQWLGKVPVVRRWLQRRELPYLASVQNGFLPVAEAPRLRVRPAGPEPSVDPDSGGEGRGVGSRPLDTFVPETGAVHLLGASGSGKSWTVESYMHDLAKAERTRRLGLDSSLPTLPLYARAGHEHLIDGLGRFLLQHGFYRDVPSKDRVRELLAGGGLTLVLDDVHLHLEDDERLDTLGLNEIMAYRDRNRVVLAGRPHVARNPFGVRQIEMAPLDTEVRAAVVKHHLGADEPRAEYLLGVLERASRGGALYQTPQALTLVTEAVRGDGRLPDRLPELFETVHRARFRAARDRSTGVFSDIETSSDVLGALAYDRLQAGAYRFTLAEARGAAGAALRVIGADVAGPLTAPGAVDALLSDGYLVRDGDGVRFEHDRWQEYFASTHVVTQHLDIGALASATAFAGVSHLVVGMQPPVIPEAERAFWTGLWDEVVARDLGLALGLLGVPGPASERDHAASASPTDEQVYAGYRSFLDRYRLLAADHLGLLRERLPPQTTGEIGVVVARKETAGGVLFRGHWLGFRALGERDDAIVVVPSVGEREDPRFLRATWSARGVTSWTPDPGVEAPPMRAALRAWVRAVEEAIGQRRLVEPLVLVHERVYYDLAAVSVALGLRAPTAWAPFALAEADALMRLPSLAGKLTDGSSSGRSWSRRVRSDELRRDYHRIREVCAAAGQITPPVWPPLPPSPGFGERHERPPTAQMLNFYREAYGAAFELATLNLPTLAELLHESIGFPIRIALRDRRGDAVGRFERVTFVGVTGQAAAVVVEVSQEAELAVLRSTLDTRGEVESSATWPGTVEPLRRKAYDVLWNAWNSVKKTERDFGGEI